MILPSRSKPLIAALALLTLAGCADYMNHRDSVTFGAGNAVEANSAIHAVKPWPPSASTTTIYSHGKMNPLGQQPKKVVAAE
jgi:hypothetical protein